MKTWEQYLTERFKQTHDYSSVAIDLPDHIARKIIKWGHDHIDNDDLYVKGRDYGREDHIHCTVLYGLKTNKPDDVKKLLEDQGPITYHLGPVTMFTTHKDYNVVKISVSSSQLLRLNKKLITLPHVQTHPRYVPHVTIAYVKKEGRYSGTFSDTIRAAEVIFSAKNGTKTAIALKT